MTQQGHGAGAPPGRKTWWIAALLALLVVAIGVWLISRAGRDDNLTPDAVAVDPNTGNLTATGIAATDASGTDTGAPAPPGAVSEDSTGGVTDRPVTPPAGTEATGAAAPAGGTATPPGTGTTAPPQ